MNINILFYIILCCFSAILICISFAIPELLSDNNEFLNEFVGSSFINVLGVILAITLASSANIHLTFNRIEESYQTEGALLKSRYALKKTTYSLIILFLLGILIVVVKSTICETLLAQSLFNSGALIILMWQVLIMVSLMHLVFLIEPVITTNKE